MQAKEADVPRGFFRLEPPRSPPTLSSPFYPPLRRATHHLRTNAHLGKRRRTETKRQRREEAEEAEETQTPSLSAQAQNFSRPPVVLSICDGGSSCTSAEPSPGRGEAKHEPEDEKEQNKEEVKRQAYNPAVYGCRSLSAYEKEGCTALGKGTFGEVWRARDVQTGRVVAIKRFGTTQDPEGEGVDPNVLREITIMATLNHPNIVRMIEVLTPAALHTNSKRRRTTFASALPSYKASVVMECLDTNLQRVIARVKHKNQVFIRSEVKSLVRQLLSAVTHLHANGVVHRDIKPSNLLYANDGTLKLCDFGISRRLWGQGQQGPGNAPGREAIHGTVWYQAPELLPHGREYTQAVDMWAAGCTFAELVLLRPLFPGWRRSEQLRLIDRLVTRKSGVLLRSAFKKEMMGRAQATPLGDVGFQLLAAMLRRDPSQRLDADAALLHPWFRKGPLPKLAKDLARA